MESRQLRELLPSEAHRDLTETSPAPRSHWLRELAIVVVFYYSYELIRRFGYGVPSYERATASARNDLVHLAFTPAQRPAMATPRASTT